MKKEGAKEKICSDGVGKLVVVAVRAAKEISKSGLVWALTHVVQPGDCIKLLVVIGSHASSKWMRGFSRFASDCTTGHQGILSGTHSDEKDDIAQACSQMVLQLHNAYDPQKVKIKTKIVSGLQRGVVAAEAKKSQSNWVILDKHLKHEGKYCMEELQCNVVVMKKSQPKVLRLNLVNSSIIEAEEASVSSSDSETSPKCRRAPVEESNIFRGPAVTPASSPDQESPITVTDAGTSSISSSDAGNSSLLSGFNGSMKKGFGNATEGSRNFPQSGSDSESEKLSPSPRASYFHKWMADIRNYVGEFSKDVMDNKVPENLATSTQEGLLERLPRPALETDIGTLYRKSDLSLSRNIRKAISLSRKAPPGPPPLCSVCRHKAPVFGNPPKWFTYAELELATDGFSRSNFLAEGGFGSVHRGILTGGQVVAVKQYKLASSQGDQEFCSEVEVLSCAQHRNVVMLIGFCVENGRRLLVYEYICNGSLDSHLYGRKCDTLKWSARQKIAVGAARGLRYLHEECRVGCIVHRDMRPNNILLTHDFEPLVGDFGLARWQPDGDLGVETRILGTFGYLAPEYAQSGQITEKADVYSFGVVLLELVTGRKAIDINRPKGQQCLTEWARTLLKKDAIQDLVDPLLRNCYSDEEVRRMLQCASLCIRHDPHLRPRMSQVLRMLEGDILT